ncbi:MAG: hypothetical protein GY941_11855 [Planctomycetes bacterium]|nr:hypothetical protein [Planctomycetota bacterium]
MSDCTDIALQQLIERRKQRGLPELHTVDEDTYHKLLRSGMFGEWYPEATGYYEADCK